MSYTLPHIERNIVEASFKIAGIKVLSIHEAANQYWPQSYPNLPPWWLVVTEYGIVIIGQILFPRHLSEQRAGKVSLRFHHALKADIAVDRIAGPV